MAQSHRLTDPPIRGVALTLPFPVVACEREGLQRQYDQLSRPKRATSRTAAKKNTTKKKVEPVKRKRVN